MLRKARKLLQLLQHRLYWRPVRYGVAAAIEHVPLLRHRKFATILDAGANKGQFALVARAHNPAARVYAFEPMAKASAIFSTVFSADINTTMIRSALGSTRETTIMNVSGRADSSSLLPIGSLQSDTFPGTAAIGQETISVQRLDDLAPALEILAPALLKIDVQGFELELLKGATQSLAKFSDIYVELSFVPFYDGQPLAAEVIAWLGQHDFALQGIYNFTPDRNGLSAQADFHFIRKSPQEAQM
jgi:FkbM family methyltransferase